MKAAKRIKIFGAVIAIIAVMLPILLTILYSFETPSILIEWITDSGHKSTWHAIKIAPTCFSLEQYFMLLVEDRGFIRQFLNSIFYALTITAIQVSTGALAAYALCFLKIRHKSAIYAVYVLMLIMPFQSIMVPNYILFRNMGILDSPYAIILSLCYYPFSLFLLRQFFSRIPKTTIEAAHIDGASPVQIFFLMAIPMSKSAVIAAAILTFSDAYNMLEQPLLYLTNQRHYPLSLAILHYKGSGIEYGAAVLYLLPIVLLYLYFSEDVRMGIQFSGLK